MMNTLTKVADVIKKTKRAEMFWEEGYHCNFYSIYGGHQYQLVLLPSLDVQLIIFPSKGEGYSDDDYYVMVDPFRDGQIARLYFLVSMLNNLKSN